jgi:hypothetical protein
LIDSGDVLLFAGLLGVAVSLVGVVIACTALFRMQKALNEQLEPDKRVSPWRVMGRGGGRHHTLIKYKTKFGNESLVHLSSVASWLIASGSVLGVGSLLILKVRS